MGESRSSGWSLFLGGSSCLVGRGSGAGRVVDRCMFCRGSKD